MAYSSWRGVLGVIKPTMRPGSLEERDSADAGRHRSRAADQQGPARVA